MERGIMLSIDNPDTLVNVTKALASEVRVEIIRLLGSHQLNVNEIAERLNIPASTAAMNVRVLEEAGLITSELQPGIRGSMKVCYKQVDAIGISLKSEAVEEERAEVINMPIGNFVDYKVVPTCGIVSDKGPIDAEDEPRCFYNPARTQAKLIWLSKGYLEYRFPNTVLKSQTAKKIELSAELCSEDHEYNLEFPSDITVWVNGIDAGTWTCPSDFGGRRGKYNPSWWPDKNTQFGVLKKWSITDQGTYIDDKKVCDTVLESYHLGEAEYISIKIGIKEDSIHQGGLNLFGDSFGDYPQNIMLKIIY